MTTINRYSSDAALSYIQQSDAARTAVTTAAQTQHAGKAHQAHASQSDSVTLSDRARSLAQARAEVEKAPDVREQKVAAIKQQVASGAYAVSAHVLARKMVAAANNTN